MEGITTGKMLGFFILTYYMGIVKKDAMKSYWSVDNALSTLFLRNAMLHSEFYNILLFLHCSAILTIQVRVNQVMIQGKNLEKFLLFYKNNLLMYGFSSKIFQLTRNNTIQRANTLQSLKPQQARQIWDENFQAM